MPIIVEVKGYGEVEFPDGTTQQEMEEALKKLPPKAEEDGRFLPPASKREQSEASKRAERLEYGGYGAGAGALGAGLLAGKEAVLSGARAVGEASEQGRIAAQRAAGLPGQVPSPEVARNIPESSGAANWARKMAKNLPYEIAESAESMTKADKMGAQALINRDIQAMEKIRGMGLGGYGLTESKPGQLMLDPNTLERLAAEKQVAAQAVPVKPTTGPLEQASQMFRRLMQTPIVKYGLPPVALGSAGMDIADIAQEQRKQDPDRIRQLLSGLQAAGAGMSLFPPTAPVGLGLSVLAPAAQYIREQQKRPQLPSEPGLTAPEAAQYVSP